MGKLQKPCPGSKMTKSKETKAFSLFFNGFGKISTNMSLPTPLVETTLLKEALAKITPERWQDVTMVTQHVIKLENELYGAYSFFRRFVIPNGNYSEKNISQGYYPEGLFFRKVITSKRILVSLFRRVVIPKISLRSLIPKSHYSENNIRVIIKKIINFHYSE